MSDRDLFIAMVLAAMSAGRTDPIGDAMRLLESFQKLDEKGSIPQ